MSSTAPYEAAPIRLSRSSVVALVGAAAVAVGSLGPWATVGVISAAGTRGDGKITLIAAVIAGLTILLGKSNRGPTVLVVILAIICAAVGVSDSVNVNNDLSSSPLLSAVAGVGWGLYAVIAGSVVMFIAAMVARLASVEAEEAPSASLVSADTVPTGMRYGYAEKLRDLAALHDDGIVTDEEFATQKAQLLGSVTQ